MTGISQPMGRPPKPTALKLLEGNPGKRQLNPSEPRPSIVPLSAPEFLDDVARAEWERIYPELYALGLVTVADLAALAAYCQAFSDWISASAEVRKSGKVLTTPNGMIQTSPHVTQARQARADMLGIATHFGLTPSARTRLSASSPIPDEAEPSMLQ